MSLSRRTATQADLPFLLALRQESMGPHLAASGLHGTPDDTLARVMHRFDCAEVLVMQGQPIGLLKLWRDSDKWQVLQLQLSANAQGRGIGRRLLEDILADADRAGVPVTLSVLKTNPAKRLYERLGFVVVGEDEHEYRMLRTSP